MRPREDFIGRATICGAGEHGLPAVVVGCLPTKLPQDAFRQAAKKDRLAACAPQRKLKRASDVGRCCECILSAGV